MESLILIDVQKGFLNERCGKRNNPEAEKNMLLLLEKFRKENKKVIHIQHLSLSPEAFFYKDKDREFKEGFEPLENEAVFQKNVNSAFIGTNLEQYLRDNKIDEIVIAGLTLPHCVSTTARMAGNLGFKVILIEDATASFELKDSRGNTLNPEEIHKYHIAALNEEFAKVMTTEEYIVKKV